MTHAEARRLRGPVRAVRNRIMDSAGWDNFPVRPDDIVISTYPKCGTTWTQRIVGMLVLQSAEPIPVHFTSPWPDFRLIPVEQTGQTASALPHRRWLKAHLPFDALPVYEGVKYIHVARDGRDAAMSFHNHKMAYSPHVLETISAISLADPKFRDTYPETDPDPAMHFHDWVNGPSDEEGDEGAGFFHVEKSFWEARREPNVLLVHFNDLKADRAGEMRRIADFLEISVPDALWPELVEAAGFDAMKKRADDLLPGADMIFKGGGRTFLNKGTNGRWKDVLHPEDLARYEAKVAARFTPGLASWIEHGRLVTGDPREMAD